MHGIVDTYTAVNVGECGRQSSTMSYKRLPSLSGMVLVMTTSSSADFSIRSAAGPLNSPWVYWIVQYAIGEREGEGAAN